MSGFQNYFRLPGPLVELLEANFFSGPVLPLKEIEVLWERSEVRNASDDTCFDLTEMVPGPRIDYAVTFGERLRHREIPTYTDTGIAIVHLYGLSFTANVDNRWVRYQAAAHDSVGKLWDHLEVLVALRRQSHVGQLVGVFIDINTRAFKGVLSEFPEAGPMRELLSQHKTLSSVVIWSRREKWAKQIVQGVAAVHSRGLNIGCLGKPHGAAIAIDGNDDTVIYRFSPLTSWNPWDAAGKLLPEYRSHDGFRSQTELTPQFDVFQLGLLLWHLFRNEERELGGAFCQLARCQRTTTGTVQSLMPTPWRCHRLRQTCHNT